MTNYSSSQYCSDNDAAGIGSGDYLMYIKAEASSRKTFFVIPPCWASNLAKPLAQDTATDGLEMDGQIMWPRMMHLG